MSKETLQCRVSKSVARDPAGNELPGLVQYTEWLKFPHGYTQIRTTRPVAPEMSFDEAAAESEAFVEGAVSDSSCYQQYIVRLRDTGAYQNNMIWKFGDGSAYHGIGLRIPETTWARWRKSIVAWMILLAVLMAGVALLGAVISLCVGMIRYIVSVALHGNIG